jgi:hypothetical protein
MIQPFAARVRNWVRLQQEATTRTPRHYASEEAAFSRMREKNHFSPMRRCATSRITRCAPMAMAPSAGSSTRA